MISVTDWNGRTTTYTYDENNQVTGVKKPDGSTTVTIYDDHQRVISTVERTAKGEIVSGFEFTYGPMGRIEIEKDIAKNIQMSYTYDDLCRVCNRRIADLNTGVITNESFSFDAASNLLTNNDSQSAYDANNRLVQHNEFYFDYDADGNITVVHTENDPISFYTFDSRNRLISDGTHTYTYNAENTRIRSVCNGVTTYYTYNTNAKLSQLLHKQTQGVVTKYVYGLGLISEEKQGTFKTYHFDYRGSTVAITDMAGNITDTFAYDTYGKLISRTGETDTPFLYNGRDGVMTEDNGLYYMRARYYSPELRRFINADIVAGEISNSPTLNRYAYANGNPVSNVDPMGLSAEQNSNVDPKTTFFTDNIELGYSAVETMKDIKTNSLPTASNTFKPSGSWVYSAGAIATETIYEVSQYDDPSDKKLAATYSITKGVVSAGGSMMATYLGTIAGAKLGTAICPGYGTAIGLLVGFVAGLAMDIYIDYTFDENKDFFFTTFGNTKGREK